MESTPTADRVTEPDRRAAAPSDDRGLGLVEVEALAGETARGQEPLVHVAELAAKAHERSRADDSRHLAVEANAPAPFPQLALQEIARAHLVGPALGGHRLALALGAVHGDIGDVRALRRRLAGADQRQQRAMSHKVRIATDRRREVGVRGASEAGVAEVSRAVVRLLQRAQHEASVGVAPVLASARLSRDEAADLPHQLGRPARAKALGKGRRGYVERGELRNQALDPRWIGALVDAVEGRDLSPLAELGDLLVGEDHQVLDQAVRLRLGDRFRSHDGAVGVEVELGLERLDLQGADATAIGQRRGRPPRERKRLGDSRGSGLSPVEDPIELVVVEALVRADAGPLEAGRPRNAVGTHDDLRGHRQALHPRREAARIVGKRSRQHRLDRARDVRARRTAKGLGLEPRAGSHVGRHVRDVDEETGVVPVDLGGDRVVEIPSGCWVDGERGERGEVAPRCANVGPARGASGRLVGDDPPEAAVRPAVPKQGGDDLAWHVGAAQRSQCARPAGPEVDQREVALANVRGPSRKRRARCPLEERLGLAKAPAPRDRGDAPPEAPPSSVHRPDRISRPRIARALR